MVIVNDSGNTRVEGIKNLCELLPRADHHISTVLAGMLTKKLTEATYGKQIQFKSHVFE